MTFPLSKFVYRKRGSQESANRGVWNDEEDIRPSFEGLLKAYRDSLNERGGSESIPWICQHPELGSYLIKNSLASSLESLPLNRGQSQHSRTPFEISQHEPKPKLESYMDGVVLINEMADDNPFEPQQSSD